MEVRNRFKGLDLTDTVPDEVWNEVRDIVQETGIKTNPMEKKYKKAKWLSAEWGTWAFSTGGTGVSDLPSCCDGILGVPFELVQLNQALS